MGSPTTDSCRQVDLCGLQAADDPGERRTPRRPARDYLGTIGRFRLEAELTPRKSKVGDPLTFTLVLSGSGSLAAVKPPDLGKARAVAGRFKVYEATQKTDATRRDSSTRCGP